MIYQILIDMNMKKKKKKEVRSYNSIQQHILQIVFYGFIWC